MLIHPLIKYSWRGPCHFATAEVAVRLIEGLRLVAAAWMPSPPHAPSSFSCLPDRICCATREFTKHTWVRLPFLSFGVGRDILACRREANPLVEKRPSIYSPASPTGSRCGRDHFDPVARAVHATSQHHARTLADQSGFGPGTPKPPWTRRVRRTSI